MWNRRSCLSALSPVNDVLLFRLVGLILLFFFLSLFSAPLEAAEPYEIPKPGDDGDWARVAADFDGEVLVIADHPAAYVYERDGDEWRLVQRLDIPKSSPATTSFGDDVSIDGDTIVVSNEHENVDGIAEAGAIYVFHRSDSGAWEFAQRLTADGPREVAEFGEEVEVEGDVIVTRAPRYASAGGPYTPDGIVHVFEYDEQREQWQHVAKFGKPADYSEVFAYHVAFSDGIIVVPENQEGGLIIYEREGDGWYRTDDIPLEGASAVAVDADVIAAGGSEGIRLFEREANGNWRSVGALDSNAVEVALETDILAVLPDYLAGRIDFYHDYFHDRADEWNWRHAQTLVFDSSRNLQFALSEKYLLANSGSRVLVYELSDVLPEIIEPDDSDSGNTGDDDGTDDGTDDTGGGDDDGGDTGGDSGGNNDDAGGDTSDDTGGDTGTGDDDPETVTGGGNDEDTGGDEGGDGGDTTGGSGGDDTSGEEPPATGGGGGGGAAGTLLLFPLAFMGLRKRLSERLKMNVKLGSRSR